MNLSVCAFLDAASSTRSMTFMAVDSECMAVTLTLIIPVRLTEPLRTVFPGPVPRGADSPVRALMSREVHPSITSPSRGMRSPGLTTMISPTDTVSGLTDTTSPSVSRLA